MRSYANIPIWQRQLNLEIWCHIWWKRTKEKKASVRLTERTKHGKNIVRKFMMRKHPWYFMVNALHSAGLTKKGKPLKLTTKDGKCMCKHCNFLWR